MILFQRKCRCCRRRFHPRPQTPKQKTCSRRACQKSRHRKDCVVWRKKNPTYDHRWRAKKRGWAKAYPDYWRHYRANHADYCQRDNARRRRAHRHPQNAANQDVWRKIAVEKLQAIVAIAPTRAANRDAYDRRVDKVLDFLAWKEEAANRDVSLGGRSLADNSDHGQPAVGQHPPPL